MAQEMGVTININEEKNGIELKFESKPNQEIIDKVKEMNFRWHNQNKLWFARHTQERLEFANKLKEELKPAILLDDIEEQKLSEYDINAVLVRGSGVSKGKFRIYEHFQKNLSSTVNTNFLKDEYGIGGGSSTVPHANISENHDSKGIELRKRGEKEDRIFLKWSEVENRIRSLISKDKYLSPEEKEQYPIYLAEKQLKEERAVIAEKFRNIIIDFNDYMEENNNKEKVLNRYILSDCASQFIQGSKTTFTLYSDNYIIPLMRDAINTIIKEDTHLNSRCEEMLELLNSDLAKQLDVDFEQEKQPYLFLYQTDANKKKTNTFANSYEYIGNDPIVNNSETGIFNSTWNGCYFSDLNIYLKRYNGNETIVITDLKNAGQKGKECKKWTINGADIFTVLQEEGIHNVKGLYNAVTSGEKIDGMMIYESSLKGIDVFSPFTVAKPLTDLPDKWTKTNFINALQSGQLFGGEIDSRYTDDYRNDYASNHSTGKRIDMSAAARKEMADWDKYTRATSGSATKEGIVPVTMYCGNTTKTYFFDKNCNIAEGKRRGEEYVNGIERYNRMMEGCCVKIPLEEINLESIYDCKILSLDNNTGIYGVKDEVVQGYLLSERVEEGRISVLKYGEFPVIDKMIYSISNFYDRADAWLEKDSRLINIGNWENVVTGKALKELTKEMVSLPNIREGPFGGDYKKLTAQIKERIITGSNFSVGAADYKAALERLESEYVRAESREMNSLEKMIENAQAKTQRYNNLSDDSFAREGGRDNEIL